VVFLAHDFDVGGVLGASKSNLRHCSPEAAKTKLFVTILNWSVDICLKEVGIIKWFELQAGKTVESECRLDDSRKVFL